MEAFESLVRRIVTCFNDVGLDYMFTGALAVNYYGRARTTTDVDIVVAVSGREWRNKLISASKKAGLVADEKKIDDALKSDYKIATFKDGKSPLTVDIILSDKKLEKRAGSILGLATFYQTTEELILTKLRMIKVTIPKERALKDEEDVKAILRFAKINIEDVKMKAKKESTLSIFDCLRLSV